jgi:NAD(P)-dependent dehydrogenase (short-subunit alcohol dehydrogenase family)
MKRFDGQVAIVTGAARGIGAATARRLAREGAAVLLTDVIDDEGEAIAAELRRAERKAIYQHLDVANEDEWRRAVDPAATMGKVTGLVNNARKGTLPDHESETREGGVKLKAINPTGVWLGMKAVAAQRKKKGGSIVNV